MPPVLRAGRAAVYLRSNPMVPAGFSGDRPNPGDGRSRLWPIAAMFSSYESPRRRPGLRPENHPRGSNESVARPPAALRCDRPSPTVPDANLAPALAQAGSPMNRSRHSGACRCLLRRLENEGNSRARRVRPCRGGAAPLTAHSFPHETTALFADLVAGHEKDAFMLRALLWEVENAA